MDIRDFYNSNIDFRGYVDRFCKTYDLSVDEALQHSTVREVAEYYREKEIEDGKIKRD